MRHLITILILFFSITLFAKDYTVDTVTINSSVLSEERVILIFKPTGLEQADSISVLYLLDGEFSENRYEYILKEQFDKPLIGIGIINTDRRRDMIPVNQPDKFLEFISSELIPEIETVYLIDQRILFGHSFAGGFTVYSLINKPNLFDRYIASSPTPIMDMVDKTIYKQLDKIIENKIKFYFSYGSKDMKQVRKWSEKLYDNFLELNFNHIDWKNEIYDGENHNSSDKISLIKGLQF